MTTNEDNNVVRSSNTPEGWEPSDEEDSPVIDGTGDRVEDYSPGEVAQMAGVKPQMIYNYIYQELIEAYKNEKDRYRIDAGVAQAWVEKYLTNKKEREEKRAREIERQLNGEY